MARKSIVDSTAYQGFLDAEDNFIEIYNDIDTLTVGTGTPCTANDSDPGVLYGTDGTDGKIRYGSGISFTLNDAGADESITIATTFDDDLKKRFLL